MTFYAPVEIYRNLKKFTAGVDDLDLNQHI